MFISIIARFVVNRRVPVALPFNSE